MDGVALTDAMCTVLTLLQGPWCPVQLRKHHHHAGTSQRQTLQSVNYACKRQISPQLNHVVTGKVKLLKYVVKLQCFYSKILDTLTDDTSVYIKLLSCVLNVM